MTIFRGLPAASRLALAVSERAHPDERGDRSGDSPSARDSTSSRCAPMAGISRLHGCSRARHLPGRVDALENSPAPSAMVANAPRCRRCGSVRAAPGSRYSRTGNTGLVQRGQAFAHGVPLSPLLDDLHHRGPVGAARRDASLKRAIIGELALSRHLAERRKISWRDRRDQEVAVASPHRTVGRREARWIGNCASCSS